MHVTPPPNPRCNSCSTITRASEVPNRGRPRPAPVSGIVAITLVVMTLTSAGCAAADALSQVRLVVGEDLNIHTSRTWLRASAAAQPADVSVMTTSVIATIPLTGAGRGLPRFGTSLARVIVEQLLQRGLGGGVTCIPV